ncbi:MAG: transporter [Candidatus Firestonebacteria bacterium]
MKKNFVICFGLLMVSFGYSQPLILEQGPNVLKTFQFEVGLEGSAAYDNFVRIETPNVEYTKKGVIVSLFGRYATDDQTEIIFNLPYKLLSSSTTGSPDENINGLGMITLGGKYFVIQESNMPSLALGLILDLPTGDPKKTVGDWGWSLGEGLNVGVSVIATKKIIEPFSISLNVSAKYRGKYTNVNDAIVIPSPLLGAGAEAELNLGNLSVMAEVYGTTFRNYKAGDLEVEGSAGNTFNTVYGVRYNVGDIKINAGIDLSAGGTTFRPYNYRIFGGVSLIFSDIK